MLKKVRKILAILLSAIVMVTSIFVADGYACEDKPLDVEAVVCDENLVPDELIFRNNPFYYHYEYDDLELTVNRHFNQAEANDRDKWIDSIALGLCISKYSTPLGVVIGIYNYFDGSHRQPGTLKIWSGEKRQIATSALTGKSHVVNTWLRYSIEYIGDDGVVLVDKSGSIHVR